MSRKVTRYSYCQHVLTQFCFTPSPTNHLQAFSFLVQYWMQAIKGRQVLQSRPVWQRYSSCSGLSHSCQYPISHVTWNSAEDSWNKVDSQSNGWARKKSLVCINQGAYKTSFTSLHSSFYGRNSSSGCSHQNWWSLSWNQRQFTEYLHDWVHEGQGRITLYCKWIGLIIIVSVHEVHW